MCIYICVYIYAYLDIYVHIYTYIYVNICYTVCTYFYMTFNGRYVCFSLKVSHLCFLVLFLRVKFPLQRCSNIIALFQTGSGNDFWKINKQTSKPKLHRHLTTFWHRPLGWGWQDPFHRSGAPSKPFKTFALLDGRGAAACAHVHGLQIKSDCGRSDSTVFAGRDFQEQTS